MEISTLDSWLSSVSNSEKTERNYRLGIQKFLECFNCILDEIASQWEKAETFRQERRFKKIWDKRVKIYRAHLKSQKLAKSTVECYMTPVASFFAWLECPVKVETKKMVYEYHNRDITREEIASIINHTAHVKEKAFFCMQAQSGLRPIVLKRLQYIDMKEDWEKGIVPVKINVPQHKNKGQYKGHFTFIPEESMEYLRQYWDIRYGKGNNPNDEDLVFSLNDNSNIPINTASESNIFSRVASKLGIVKERNNGKPKQIRMYCLVKWFRNHASESPEVDSEYAHFWHGHILVRQDEHYFTTNVDVHREKYRKAMPFLKISEYKESTVIQGLKEKIQCVEKELEKEKGEKEAYNRLVQLLQSKGVVSASELKMIGFNNVLVEHAKRTMAYAEIQDVERNIKLSPIQILQVAKDESTEQVVTSNEDIKPKRLFEEKKLIE